MTEKLDHIKDLGIDCIWLLPIYPSPLNDDGYDIADYYGVHPDYGTIEDFKTLVDEAHARDMRVIADLVLNHTSDQHPWFQEARKDPNRPTVIIMCGRIRMMYTREPALSSRIPNPQTGPGMRLRGSISGTVSMHPNPI